MRCQLNSNSGRNEIYNSLKMWMLVCACLLFINGRAIADPLAVANGTYLSTRLSRFMTEPDTASDLGDWKTVCTVPDMQLAQIRRETRSPPDTSLARAGQAWLRAKGEYAVLSMPGCQIRLIKKPDVATPVDLHFVSPAGVYLLKSWDNKTGLTHWWVGNGSLRPLSRAPADPRFGTPVLSNDGNWVAWVEMIPDGTKRRRAVIQSLDDDRSRLVDIPDQTHSAWVLLAADIERQELTFYEHAYPSGLNSLTVLGFDGERRGQPVVAEGLNAQFTSMLRVGTGWVAWDATPEDFESYRIAWLLAGERETHHTLKGRSITAVEVDPSGTYIAVSETNAIRDNYVKDAVYVLRTSDGKEIWHRSLPRYARSSLAFLGDKLFAYTESDGAHSTVRVLQIPE